MNGMMSLIIVVFILHIHMKINDVIGLWENEVVEDCSTVQTTRLFLLTSYSQGDNRLQENLIGLNYTTRINIHIDI